MRSLVSCTVYEQSYFYYHLRAAYVLYRLRITIWRPPGLPETPQIADFVFWNMKCWMGLGVVW